MSGMSGLKAPINTHCRITTPIDNPPIPCIALYVLCIVILVAIAINIIGYTVSLPYPVYQYPLAAVVVIITYRYPNWMPRDWRW